MEVLTDPRAEWKQEYNEVWRIERDFFYDPNLHGLNLPATRKQYEPYLENIGSRIDFSYLLAEMLVELTVGHMYNTHAHRSAVRSGQSWVARR